MIPSGGGVGTSTILATLGRIFALRKERVLLLDGVSNSVLPFYFGAANPLSGACVFHERLTGAEHFIHVVARKQGGEELGESDESLWSSVEPLLQGVDRLLVDAWSGMANTVYQRLVGETSRLVVLVADLRSVVRVRALLEHFQEQERVRGQDPAPHFLLNQFDASVPLHRELRASLAELLGERLLPFTLRRTDEVALSLAEGVTIVDYAPGSGLAEDFLRLADWINLWQPARSEIYETKAAGGSR